MGTDTAESIDATAVEARGSLAIARVRPATAAEWDASWSRCRYATYFHSRAWAEAWHSASGGRIRPSPLLVEFDDGLRAVLPLSVRHGCAGLVRTSLSSPAGTYGGWISADRLTAAHHDLLEQRLLRASRLVWRTNPFDGVDRDDDGDPTLALRLDGGFETLHRRWSKGHRAAAKQAKRAGVEVRTAESTEDWRGYFSIYRETLERWAERATSTYGQELFDRLATREPSEVRLWLAIHSGETVAGALCLYSAQHVSYWHGAARESALKLRPVHLLMHEAIRDACGSGRSWFDFNPSGGHDGVHAFKKSFGCEQLPAPVITRRPGWTRFTRKLLHR